jgi:HEAT repeat protein
MSWPLSQDYNEAIQNPRSSFSDAELCAAEPVSNALGIPIPRSGNFADVYEMRSAAGRWAIKCFTRQVSSLSERYAAISRHLREANLPFAVDFTFLEQGIRVRGQWYPALKMQWVEGLTLNEFVRQYADRPPMLKNLLLIWVRMAARLREAGIAHADLQHGNVLLVPGSTANSLAVKLVDYDGMWVPGLEGKKSGEVGHPNYQHPQRLREGTYSGEVDRFPLLVVATALSCLEVGGRALWDRYDSGDNLLFREADLQAPVKSPLFYELLKLGSERAPRLVQQTLDALKGRLEAVPLLEEVLPELHAAAAPKPAVAPEGRKRTTAVKSVAPPLAPVAQSISADSPWDLGGEDRQIVRRRKGKAGWTSVAVTVLIVVLGLAGGLFALAFRSEPTRPKEKTRIAKNDTRKSSPDGGKTQATGDSARPPPAVPAETTIEGEGLRVLGKSSGFPVGTQNMSGFPNHRWSGDAQLWCQARRNGDWVDLELPVAVEGKYRIIACMTRARDYGIVQFSLDGMLLGQPIDGFNFPQVIRTEPIDLGIVELKKGASTLRIEVVGANARSVGFRYLCGLDCLILQGVPASMPVPRRDLALRADASVAELCQALKNESPAVQEKAAELLARFGPKAYPAMDDLADALTNGKNSPQLRSLASLAIGRIGAGARPVVPALVKALEKQEPIEVRRSAAEALALMSYPANKLAVPTLVDIIGNEADPLLLQRCIWSLFAMDRKGFVECGADRMLAKFLNDSDENSRFVRYDAARKLARELREEASDRTTEVLLRMLSDRGVRLYQTGIGASGDGRYMAAEALGWLGQKAARNPDVVKALKEAARDNNVQFRTVAQRALKDLRVPD